ncbi:thioredoxin [Levilactobacillus bambusae]|uniref:Thioredoxin n=1 Tax=Levilactobacillus bambusae TaxID=2024736 RepID=A0A2V1MZF4_9LACO|nr:thioredoxin [Levilactobacillus bambusae]PWG00192.1 thioredoxin [Levilactobacillus bambusae]
MLEQLTTETFHEFGHDQPVAVIDFWADWCGPCKMQTPVIEHLAANYGNRVAFAALDVDQHQDIAKEFGIMSIPALLILKNGHPVERVVGFHPEGALKKYLDKKLDEVDASSEPED